VVALLVLGLLAIIIGLASILSTGPSAPDVGEAETTTAVSIVTVTTLNSSSVSPRSSLRPGVIDIEALAVASVVSIDIYSGNEICSGGTGSVVLDGNHVITSLHVVEDDSENDCYADEIVVKYLNQVDSQPVQGFTAKIVATSATADLAVLRLTRGANVAKVLAPLSLQSEAAVNEDLYIIGFPAIGGDSVTFSRGIVGGFTQDGGVRWIKTDAQVSGGNSGGPAFNSRGELIGVLTKATSSSSGEIVDCRIAADTNSDGRIDNRDACVPIGGSFSLLSPTSEVEKLLKKVIP
jgi:S1-C subfamily serine protease